MSDRRRSIGAVALVAATAVGSATLTGASPSTASPASTSHTPSAAQISTQSAEVRSPGTVTSRVFGTFGRNGVVRGNFIPIRWVQRAGTVYALGTLRANLRRGDGTLVGSVNRQVQLPLRTGSVESTQRVTCQILHLVLGPLDLNLLGLHVHLNRVVLHIEAISGPGNLLGNLLCAVAGLLDPNTLLDRLRLTNNLNRILNLVL